MKMTYKEKLEVVRVITAISLLIISVYGMFNHSDGWGWFLFIGAVFYPNNINIDFREAK